MSKTKNDFKKTNGDVEESQNFNLGEFVGKILNSWKLFLVFFLIFVLVGFLFVRFFRPKYEIDSSILVEAQSNSPAGGLGASMTGGGGSLGALTDVSSLLGIPSNANNEVQVLQSQSLFTNVVQKLQLNISTFRRDIVGGIELYKNSPFTVDIHYKSDSLDLMKYKIDINGNAIHITNGEEDVDINSKFASVIVLPQYDIILNRTSVPADKDGYYMTIKSVEKTVEDLSDDYDVTLADKLATIINLTFKYKNPAKGEAILNEIMKEYLKTDLADKVQIADSTITFIDGELALVSTQLAGVETRLEKFKTQNNIADITAQSQALIDASSDYQKQLAAIEIQLSVIEDFENTLNDPNNKKILPATLAIQDQTFATAVAMYNELLLERDRETISSTEDNPFVKNLDLQLANFRVTLLKSVASYKAGLIVSKNELISKNTKFNTQISSVPAKERIFLDYSRQQDLKQALYLFLLQERETTAISEKSTISSSRIIDNAKSEYEAPKGPLIIGVLVCLVLAFFIPFVYITLKEALQIKIVTKSDVENASDIPIVGEIAHNEEDTGLIVNSNLRSVISEQFRAVRTNLHYLLSKSQSNVIMITSSMSGEGKSFISANLASVLALIGKKVVLLELDLRKPKLSNYLGMDNNYGFTDYIISDNIDEQSLIKPTFFSENCFIISSGPIPPNPSELLMSTRVETLMEYLRNNFDYILIDSAPVGLISDALLVEKFVDINLYILRQNYTFKRQLEIPNNLIESGRLKKTYFIINDIVAPNTRYGYGYGYAYGYGYGSYIEDQKALKKPIKNIFGK